MPTQSIIVYRNPLEQAFWESGVFGPICIGGLVFLLAVVGLHKFLDFISPRMKISRFGNVYRNLSNLFMLISAGAGLYALFYFL